MPSFLISGGMGLKKVRFLEPERVLKAVNPARGKD